MAGIVTSTSAMLEERALDFTGRLGAARISAAEALETDLGKLAEARKGIEIYLNEHSRKLAESGDRMTSLHTGRPAALRREPRRDGARRSMRRCANWPIAVMRWLRHLPAICSALMNPAPDRPVAGRAIAQDRRRARNVCSRHFWLTPRSWRRAATASMTWSRRMSPSCLKAAISSPARWKPMRPSSMAWSRTRPQKFAEGRTALSHAFDKDLERLDAVVTAQTARLAETRAR